MTDTIYDNHGKPIAWITPDNRAESLDGKTTYKLDAIGNLLDSNGKVVGHLIPAGEYLPDGRPAPEQTLF